MAISTIASTDNGAVSLVKINDNFTDLDTTKADLASPALTGNPTAPTQSANDNSTKLATTAYVDGFALTSKTGIATRDLNTASGNQVIAHGLGKIPKLVRISVVSVSSGTINSANSFGTYDGTNTACVWHTIDSLNSSPHTYIGSSTTYIIYLVSTGTTVFSEATVTVDATNITLAWTLVSNGDRTAQIMWEVI